MGLPAVAFMMCFKGAPPDRFTKSSTCPLPLESTALAHSAVREQVSGEREYHTEEV
jgi:hypothetical protein